MVLPVNRSIDDDAVYARTTSIGATPAAGSTIAIRKGNVLRAWAFSEGASTGTISVAIAINGGSSIGTISFTGGSNTSGSVEISPSASTYVNEGDLITFTPSGGGGATIPGHFYALIG